MKDYKHLPLEEQVAYLEGEIINLQVALRRTATNDERREQDYVRLKNRNEELERLVGKDSLTGLANRNAFFDEMGKFLSAVRRKKRSGTLVFIDLDKFKWVNDVLDHDAGDQVLMAIGQILATSFRPTDYVARLSGDEFAVFLKDIVDRKLAESIIEKARTKVREITVPHERLKALRAKRGTPWIVDLSAGYFIVENIQHDTQQLLKLAEADVEKFKAARLP